MSEYQYYEFLSLDRPLSEDDRKQLRGLSTRADITSTSFINTYNFGDFGGNPEEMMKRWFDMHLYLANWGSVRLMIRLPKQFVERSQLEPFLFGSEAVTLIDSGEHLILDIDDYDEEENWYDFDDGVDRLSPLVPLRSDLLSGDLRMLYLIWLIGVQDGSLREELAEPLPGIAPLTGALNAFATLLRLDSDLVHAAAERSAEDEDTEISSELLHKALSAISNKDKTDLLARFYNGDPHASVELRRQVREAASSKTSKKPAEWRTVRELRERAVEVGEERRLAEAAKREEKRKQQELERQRVRRENKEIIRRMGDDQAWGIAEREINNSSRESYTRAVNLLSILEELSVEDGTKAQFTSRLNELKQRHSRKKSLLRMFVGKLS